MRNKQLDGNVNPATLTTEKKYLYFSGESKKCDICQIFKTTTVGAEFLCGQIDIILK